MLELQMSVYEPRIPSYMSLVKYVVGLRETLKL